MTNDEIKKFTIYEILLDYKIIINYFQICFKNNLDLAYSVGLLPFVSMCVNEGYKRLRNYCDLPPSILTCEDKKLISECRAIGLKLYDGFAFSTFNKLNNFNWNEYVAFYKDMCSNNETIKLNSKVCNYFLCSINNSPVGNYHLFYEKIFNLSIGSYNDRVPEQVYKFVHRLIGFMCRILASFKIDVIDEVQKVVMPLKLNYVDYNMAFNYDRFRIKNMPPVLIALLDVLCVLNYYKYLFCKINHYSFINFKVKYITLFYSIISVKSIFKYCQENKIELPNNSQLNELTLMYDNKFIFNDIRKCIMHYDYLTCSKYSEDPLKEKIEEKFKCSIKNFLIVFDADYDYYAKMLEKYLLK